MVPAPNRGIWWRRLLLQYGIGHRDARKAAVYICASIFRRSDDSVFGFDLWFLNAGQKFVHELVGWVTSWRASVTVGCPHNGQARSWAVCFRHSSLTVKGEEDEMMIGH